MDNLPAIVTIALAGLGVVLQIIILAVVLAAKKNLLTAIEAIAKPRDQRPVDRPFDRGRPPQQQPREHHQREIRPPTPQPVQPQPAASVDRSLRDINLRLKNAEQDQERARQKMREISVDGARGGNRDYRDNRDTRDHRDSRGGHDRGRGRNDSRGRRDYRPGGGGGGPWQPRQPDQNRPYQAPVPPVSSPAAPAVFEVQPAEIKPVQPPAPVAAEAVTIPVSDIQYDRKFPVKRRPNEPADQDTGGAENKPAAPDAGVESGSKPAGTEAGGEANASQPIVFGRR